MGHRILYIPKTQDDAFITEWNMPSGSFTLPIRSGYSYNMIVDWGDGSPSSTVTAYNDADATHTYDTGTYQIRITGTCGSWYIHNTTAIKDLITKVISWGKVGMTTLEYAFQGCANLTSIPLAKIPYNVGLTRYMFNNCTSLSSIPNGLMDNMTSLGDVGAMFSGCSSITAIPDGLLDNCTQITTIGYMFQSTSITSIPSGLLDNLTVLDRASWAFDNTYISSIPSGLFDNNADLKYVDYMFYRCTSLTTIPNGLFNTTNNPLGEDFRATFRGCSSVTSAVPELWNDYTLIISTYSNDCFLGCTNASNYASIPLAWR